jgi:hypothetical protein
MEDEKFSQLVPHPTHPQDLQEIHLKFKSEKESLRIEISQLRQKNENLQVELSNLYEMLELRKHQKTSLMNEVCHIESYFRTVS